MARGDIERARYEAKIETLEYILSYECKCKLAPELEQHIKQLIKEYKLLINELQPVSSSFSDSDRSRGDG